MALGRPCIGGGVMIPAMMALLGGGVDIAAPFLAVYGGSGSEGLYGVAYDSDGNLICVGSTTSTGKIGSTDGIVVKLDNKGVLVWARTYGAATKTTNFYGVAIDSIDNIVVAGSSNEPGYGNNDCIVLKLSGADGSITWQRELGNAGEQNFFAVAVDGSGNIACAGTSAGNNLVAYYNSSGTIQWHRTLSDGGGNFVCIDFDSSGNVYCGGNLASSTRGAVAKYNSSGSIQWQRLLSVGTNALLVAGVSVNASGNIGVAVSNDTANITHFATLSSVPAITWQRQLTVTALTLGAPPNGDCYLDDSGNLYGLTAASITTASSVAAQWNSSGTIQWQNRVRDDNLTDQVGPYRIALGNGQMAFCGSTNAVGSGGFDGFVVQARPDGTGTGTRNTLEYEAAGLTEAAASMVLSSASGTDAAGSLTSATSGLTSSALSLTLTVS